MASTLPEYLRISILALGFWVFADNPGRRTSPISVSVDQSVDHLSGGQDYGGSQVTGY